MTKEFSDFSELDAVKDHPASEQLDVIFRSVIKDEKSSNRGTETMSATKAAVSPDELSFDEVEELEIDLSGGDDAPPEHTMVTALDEGLDLSFDEQEGLDITSSETPQNLSSEETNFGDLDLNESESFSLDTKTEIRSSDELNLDELDLGTDLSTDIGSEELDSFEELSLNEDGQSAIMNLGDEGTSLDADFGLSLDEEESPEVNLSSVTDLSADAREKLKEIDAIMDLDASRVDITRVGLKLNEENLDEPLVSDDLDLGSLDFSAEEIVDDEPTQVAREVPKKKKKEAAVQVKAPAPVIEVRESRSREMGQELREISGAYSGEMERMQATISNLRADREELLNRIQKLEDDRVLQSRQSLTMRAELDEKKIELMIMRKKLNEENNDLKDRLKLFEEKRLIIEEKNRVITQELDKAAQKNKIDVKKVQLRERELEQKLELLKSDAESQIRHRDLKILELKRKIDAMEFDMESISLQEKRSVESRFELEDKLEKAIKTLRGAITVLEDESDRSNALDALKKNIDM
jgi:hypothetical protein